MLALRVEYLTGRVVATAYNDRSKVEWPPHPARLFSALVATWADGELTADEERALEVLAELPPPALHCSEASRRTVMTHFVPVNDSTVLSKQHTALEKLHVEERALEDAALQVALESDAKVRAKAEKRLGAERVKLAAKRAKRLAEFRSVDTSAQSDLDQAHSVLPDHRTKQPRTFPSAGLPDPVVHFVWDSSVDDVTRAALASLARRVTRLGHSSSLVACRLVDQHPVPTLVPREDGGMVLRVTQAGQLQRLREAWSRHEETEPRVLACGFQRYGEPTTAVGEVSLGVFSQEWLVLARTGGSRPRITDVAAVAQAARGALMRHSPVQPPPPILSGHELGGAPLQRPHLAIVPLPFVGHPHADGSVLGIAIVFPRDCDPSERRLVLQALGRWQQAGGTAEPTVDLLLGRGGSVQLELHAEGDAGPATLRAGVWHREATVWISATPVALDRNPGDLAASDPADRVKAYRNAEESIAVACTNVGLPRPVEVQVTSSVPLAGGAKARQYPPFPANPAKPQRVKVHATIRFAEPVGGPVLIGAGRYYGLGLFRPIPGGA